MTSVYNQTSLKSTRQKLRQDQTDAERKIWNMVRGRRLLGLKFFRQYSVGRYILDLYCPQLRFSIEIDGGQHNEESARVYDTKRAEYLESCGIIVVRFWNTDVLDNLDGVYEHLLANLKPLLASPYIKGRKKNKLAIKLIVLP